MNVKIFTRFIAIKITPKTNGSKLLVILEPCSAGTLYHSSVREWA